MTSPRTRTRTPRSIIGLVVALALATSACDLPATVEKPISPARTVTGLTDLERRQAIMDPSIYAITKPDLPISSEPTPTDGPTFTKVFAHSCGVATCTMYFTVDMTRKIAQKGYWAAAAAVWVPGWVGKVVAVVVALVGGLANEAWSADPPRCLTVRFTRGVLVQVVSLGHVHPDNYFCRSGK